MCLWNRDFASLIQLLWPLRSWFPGEEQWRSVDGKGHFRLWLSFSWTLRYRHLRPSSTCWRILTKTKTIWQRRKGERWVGRLWGGKRSKGNINNRIKGPDIERDVEQRRWGRREQREAVKKWIRRWSTILLCRSPPRGRGWRWWGLLPWSLKLDAGRSWSRAPRITPAGTRTMIEINALWNDNDRQRKMDRCWNQL